MPVIFWRCWAMKSAKRVRRKNGALSNDAKNAKLAALKDHLWLLVVGQ